MSSWSYEWREAKEPPCFASNPQEAYDFVCSVFEESIAAKEKYKAKYAGTSAQNKKLRSIVHKKIEQIEALESTVSAEGFDNGIMGDRKVPVLYQTGNISPTCKG